MPWKPNHPLLPTNETIAKGRIRCTVRRLATVPGKLRAYNQIITEQEKRGFIEKIPHSLPSAPCYRERLLYHSTSCVFDCSCKTNDSQPSLNDCLTTGLPHLNDLTAILIRFHRYRYALTADIEKAFLHIIVEEEDRDATPFFWLSDPNNPESPFDIYRFIRVRWNPNTDTLQFQQRQPPNNANKIITKTDVFREFSKIYDPLGILTPVTIRAKILMQELWKEPSYFQLPSA